MKKVIKIITNIVYFSIAIATFLLMINSILNLQSKVSDLTYNNIELNNKISEDKEKYEDTIMNIVKTVQITDSYLFIGGFNQEESAAFNVKKYEDMLTLKSDLDNLLENAGNFFDERAEYFEGLPDIWPININIPIRVSSPFGDRYSPFTDKVYFHEGIDLVSPAGTEVIATASGKVVQHWLNHPIFGKYLVIQLDSDEELCIHYAHLSKSYIVYGDKVEKGEVIGVIGNSGQSTGTHLHYAVSRNGIYIDPAGFLKQQDIN
jgi:murein DD-endopeptidase MepM/ murein hydrolase activator NlpD